MAPAGLTRVPFLGTAIKFFIPCLLYRYFPSRERLIGTVQPLAGEPDDYSLQVFDATLRHLKLNVAPPGPFDKITLAGFKAPTLLLLAKSDIFIPVEPARRRAKELLSQSHRRGSVRGAAHSPEVDLASQRRTDQDVLKRNLVR